MGGAPGAEAVRGVKAGWRQLGRGVFGGIACGLGLLALASCGSLGRGKVDGGGEQEEERPPHGQVEGDVVGRVELVRELEGFVMWASPGRVGLPEGAALVARPAGQVGGGARLKLSPERQGRLHTADIVEGRPKAGDLVLVGVVGEERGRGRRVLEQPGEVDQAAGFGEVGEVGGEVGASEAELAASAAAAGAVGLPPVVGEREGEWQRPAAIQVEERPDLAPVPMSVLDTPGGIEAWRGR